jgi:hypothetical protein
MTKREMMARHWEKVVDDWTSDPAILDAVNELVKLVDACEGELAEKRRGLARVKKQRDDYYARVTFVAREALAEAEPGNVLHLGLLRGALERIIG